MDPPHITMATGQLNYHSNNIECITTTITTTQQQTTNIIYTIIIQKVPIFMNSFTFPLFLGLGSIILVQPYRMLLSVVQTPLQLQ